MQSWTQNTSDATPTIIIDFSICRYCSSSSVQLIARQEWKWCSRKTELSTSLGKELLELFKLYLARVVAVNTIKQFIDIDC